MGRFTHEAIAVDPHTGIVYETEDAGFTSGFYRYVPSQRGKLAAGGTLQMLASKASRSTTRAPARSPTSRSTRSG